MLLLDFEEHFNVFVVSYGWLYGFDGDLRGLKMMLQPTEYPDNFYHGYHYHYQEETALNMIHTGRSRWVILCVSPAADSCFGF